MTQKSDSEFRCVEFKREAQARILERIKDLTPAQEIEYFRHATEQGPFAAWWMQVREHSSAQDGPSQSVPS
jgi:hypothetical protein